MSVKNEGWLTEDTVKDRATQKLNELRSLAGGSLSSPGIVLNNSLVDGKVIVDSQPATSVSAAKKCAAGTVHRMAGELQGQSGSGLLQ